MLCTFLGVGLLGIARPLPAESQERGSITAVARVISTGASVEGLRGTARVIDGWRASPDSARRVEAGLAVVTLRVAVRSGGSQERATAGAGEPASPRVVALVSIHYLRN